MHTGLQRTGKAAGRTRVLPGGRVKPHENPWSESTSNRTVKVSFGESEDKLQRSLTLGKTKLNKTKKKQ